jgi:hypothetical protein
MVVLGLGIGAEPAQARTVTVAATTSTVPTNRCIPLRQISVTWTHPDGSPAPANSPDAIAAYTYQTLEGVQFTEIASPANWNAAEHTDAENVRVGLPPRSSDPLGPAHYNSIHLRSVGPGSPCQNPNGGQFGSFNH